MDLHALGAIEPPRWILVFSRKSKVWWVRLLVRGKYKHVTAFAYVPGLDIYLFYDVACDRTGIVVAPNNQETIRGYLAQFTADADLMAAPVMKATPRPKLRLFGFWCAMSIKHLIGLRSSALLPTALWRDCLRAGGEPLGQSFLSTAVPAARP